MVGALRTFQQLDDNHHEGALAGVVCSTRPAAPAPTTAAKANNAKPEVEAASLGQGQGSVLAAFVFDEQGARPAVGLNATFESDYARVEEWAALAAAARVLPCFLLAALVAPGDWEEYFDALADVLFGPACHATALLKVYDARLVPFVAVLRVAPLPFPEVGRLGKVISFRRAPACKHLREQAGPRPGSLLAVQQAAKKGKGKEQPASARRRGGKQQQEQLLQAQPQQQFVAMPPPPPAPTAPVSAPPSIAVAGGAMGPLQQQLRRAGHGPIPLLHQQGGGASGGGSMPFPPAPPPPPLHFSPPPPQYHNVTLLSALGVSAPSRGHRLSGSGAGLPGIPSLPTPDAMMQRAAAALAGCNGDGEHGRGLLVQEQQQQQATQPSQTASAEAAGQGAAAWRGRGRREWLAADSNNLRSERNNGGWYR